MLSQERGLVSKTLCIDPVVLVEETLLLSAQESHQLEVLPKGFVTDGQQPHGI